MKKEIHGPGSHKDIIYLLRLVLFRKSLLSFPGVAVYDLVSQGVPFAD